MVYFAAHHLKTGSCVAVTGSHNPPEYNGLKIVVQGETLSGEQIQDLRRRVEENDLATGAGGFERQDIARAYLDRVTGDVKLARPMKLVVDCGNGVPGGTAPELYRALGCEVYELFCEVDGTFPNHHPDPSHPENLNDVIKALREGKGELGFAFDGDGDRLGGSDEKREDHLPGPPADALRSGCAETPAGGRHHLRHQVHAQPRAVGGKARRASRSSGKPVTR
jgi:phosphomannomutase/phosphoglucomutase